RAASFVVRRAAVADQILEAGGRRAAAGRSPAGERRRIVDDRDLAAGYREVRGAGRVGRRQRRSVGSTGGELDEIAAARGNRAAERGRTPAGARGRRVLERPAVDGDRARATVEELDVVVRVGSAAVAACGVELLDDDAARAAAACRGGCKWECEQREQEEQVDALHGA